MFTRVLAAGYRIDYRPDAVNWHRRSSGDDPLPWSAHRALWDVLDAHAEQVRFHRRLGGVRPLEAPVERRAG